MLFWALIVLIGAAVGAVLAIHFVITNVQASLLVTDAPVKAYLDQPLQVKATVLNDLSIRLDERVSTVVPVDTVLNVPVDETLQLLVSVDAAVPVRTSVQEDDVIRLNQEIDIDTVVEADLLGETFELPLRGRFPVQAEVPVRLVVPIEQRVALKFEAPVNAKLFQDLRVPLKTEIAAEVPLRAEMTVPVLNDLEATATIPKAPLIDLKLNYADLQIPLHTLGIRFEDDEPAAADAAVQEPPP